MQMSPYEIFRREPTILGSFAQARTFERASRLVNSHIVQVKEMVTHTFPLEAVGRCPADVDDGT